MNEPGVRTIGRTEEPTQQRAKEGKVPCRERAEMGPVACTARTPAAGVRTGRIRRGVGLRRRRGRRTVRFGARSLAGRGCLQLQKYICIRVQKSEPERKPE